MPRPTSGRLSRLLHLSCLSRLPHQSHLPRAMRPSSPLPGPLPRRAGATLALACSLLVGATFGGLLPVPAQAQLLADPRVDWQTADSAHFRVHYRSTQRAQADAVARAAERVYGRITNALAWEPRGKTEIVLYAELDIANGFTTPLPYNKIGVFLSPPDEGQLLDNSAWLDLLLVHEFTHAVHLDKVRGVPSVLQAIFGRVPWFMPNLFQPGWATEGIATYFESDPATGRGRLKSPLYEAWLRAERASGFLSLREINADGRALPLSKQYLYGAYFYDFLARRYGADKPAAVIQQYSGNIVPRLHSNPSGATGKMMDELWDEFLADLAQQVDERAAALRAVPEALGPRVLGPMFNMPNVAALPDGALLAVLDDGVGATQLVRLNADGTRQALANVNGDARISVAADGRVLVAQYDVCNTLYLSYDLYRLDGSRLQQLTSCAHLRRAVDAGQHIVALQLEGGQTRLVRLAEKGAEPAVLYTPEAGTDLIDLAASADGQRLSLIQRRAGDWRVLELDLAQPGAVPRVLLRRNAPLYGLRQSSQGLEVIAAVGGVHNVWRLAGGEFSRLTHSHTSVVAHGGTGADGTLATVVIAPQGFALHRLPGATALQTLPADTSGAAMPALAADAATAAEGAAVMGDGVAYSALRSLAPRSWFPAIVADRGLTAYGASTSGADALGWHQYLVTAMVETSQKELVGALEYVFADSHGLALSRTLAAQAWTGSKGKEDTTVFDRNTKLQWLSLVPFTRLQQRFTLGVGAAIDRSDRVDIAAGSTARRRDEKVMAAIVDFDTRASNWYSEGVNRGLRATVQYESYKPFADGDTPVYSGAVLRGDLRGFVPLGRSVLAVRATEVHASGSTERYQLGGAIDEALQIGYVLNNRSLSLRGYEGNERALQGRHARVGSIEWRTTLADVDRHFMVPAVGINRLSATVFADIGGAWDAGHRPATWHRSVGVELLAETRLLYSLGLQLRLGVARALDGARGTTAYLTLGRGF